MAAEIVEVLKKARKLVAKGGLVRDRAAHTAEDTAGNLVEYIDPKAVRFSPSGAIWLAERNTTGGRLTTIHDRALDAFARPVNDFIRIKRLQAEEGGNAEKRPEAAKDSFMEEYRKPSTKLEDVLNWFDVAIEHSTKRGGQDIDVSSNEEDGPA